MTQSTPPSLNVFFSYSHRDEAMRNELEKHLSVLKRNGYIKIWHDRKITPGAEWAGIIDEHLENADIVLILISPDFIASDYCYDLELSTALKRHRRGAATVVPIIIRPVDWDRTPFASLQALPTDGKPISLWPNIDEAFAATSIGIRSLCDKIAMAKVPGPITGDIADAKNKIINIALSIFSPSSYEDLFNEMPKHLIDGVETILSSMEGAINEFMGAANGGLLSQRRRQALIRSLVRPINATIVNDLKNMDLSNFPKGSVQQLHSFNTNSLSQIQIVPRFEELNAYSDEFKAMADALRLSLYRRTIQSIGLMEEIDDLVSHKPNPVVLAFSLLILGIRGIEPLLGIKRLEWVDDLHDLFCNRNPLLLMLKEGWLTSEIVYLMRETELASKLEDIGMQPISFNINSSNDCGHLLCFYMRLMTQWIKSLGESTRAFKIVISDIFPGINI